MKGLNRKKYDKDFLYLINSYEIFCLSETFIVEGDLSVYDSIFPNYKLFWVKAKKENR